MDFLLYQKLHLLIYATLFKRHNYSNSIWQLNLEIVKKKEKIDHFSLKIEYLENENSFLYEMKIIFK